jgi:hypothetical protein
MYFRPGQFQYFGAAAIVVEVSMANQEDFNVVEMKSKLFHTLSDERNRSRQIAIDQNVPGGRGDQIRGQPATANVVNVADHPVRRKRLTPFR